MPLLEMKNEEKVTHDILSEYELETKAITVSKERSKYVLLKDEEVKQCTGSLTSHCVLRSPVYPVNLSKFCIISLFMRNKEKRHETCRTLVRPSSVLPMAEYMSSGVWIITTQKRLRLSIVCHNGQEASEFIRIYQFDSVVHIDAPCSKNCDRLICPL